MLKKIFNQAIKNGYNKYEDYYENFKSDSWFFADDNICRGEYDDYEEIRITDFIFDHNFAKAFFGTQEDCFELAENNYKMNYFCDFACGDTGVECEAWRYHLQQMVLEEEPLKYLEKFLEK